MLNMHSASPQETSLRHPRVLPLFKGCRGRYLNDTMPRERASWILDNIIDFSEQQAHHFEIVQFKEALDANLLTYWYPK